MDALQNKHPVRETMKASDLPVLSNCVNTLLGKLIGKQLDLEDLQRKAFLRQNEREQVAQLTDEIANLEQRLQRAERLQDAAMASPE